MFTLLPKTVLSIVPNFSQIQAIHKRKLAGITQVLAYMAECLCDRQLVVIAGLIDNDSLVVAEGTQRSSAKVGELLCPSLQIFAERGGFSSKGFCSQSRIGAK